MEHRLTHVFAYVCPNKVQQQNTVFILKVAKLTHSELTNNFEASIILTSGLGWPNRRDVDKVDIGITYHL